MSGWIQYIQITSENGRTADMMDVGDHPAIEADSGGPGQFENTRLLAIDPSVLPMGEAVATDTTIFSWDSSLPTTENGGGLYEQEAVTGEFAG